MIRTGFSLIVICFFLTGCISESTIVEKRIPVHLIIQGNGTVRGFPFDNTVLEGDTLLLNAEADAGYLFAGWNTGLFSTVNPLFVKVERETTLCVLFVKKPENLIFIPAKDSTFTMGSSNPAVNNIERPSHTVTFTHDFYIGSSEVTRLEYQRSMNQAGNTASVQHGDSLPITNITWYDAVRYCNRRSKFEGYDTVYTYTAECASPGECPYILENLEIHYERFGYRLPTEAEWEYACHGGASDEFFWGNDTLDAGRYAWYAANAGNIIHPVGRKLPNGFALYDITGNAAEWVNDWLEYYKDSLYVDPIGPVDLTQEEFIASGQRPIKGGSYRLSSVYLRPSMRKGPYEMAASATQIDVGFRVAMGVFDAPKQQPEILIPGSLNATIACNKSDLITAIGTNSIKVAFVYTIGLKRFCAAVDFDESPVQIITCTKDSLVYSPVISPDGNFIAWGSKGEGSNGEGTVSIRSLSDSFPLTATLSGFLPRWWVDSQSNDTFLIYTDGTSSNDQEIWYHEKTFRHKITGGAPSGEKELLWNTGSYHGGLSSDGRFLGTSYPRAKLVDLQLKDTNLVYFLPPWNGRNDTPQVCNLSMSPSKADPGEALLLDFGYTGISSLLNKAYDVHAVLFIANTLMLSDKHVSQWFEAPAAYGRWNYPEFTNHPDMIITLAQTTYGEDSNAVVIINRRDSTYTDVIKGVDFREVHAWIDPTKVSETEDPYRHFGKYDVPIQMSGHVTLAKKLRLLWHERSNVSCVAVGNSPMLYGFDPHAITVVPTINIAWFQNCIGGSLRVAMQYVLPLVPDLKVLIIDLDASYFNIDGSWITGLASTKGYELDSSEHFYRDGLPQPVIDKAVSFTSEQWNGFDLQGAFIDSIFGEGWGEPIIEGNGYTIDDSIVQTNIALLETLITTAGAYGVKILAINFPQNPAYRNTSMVGRNGPRHEVYQQLVEVLATLTERYDNFYFYDANNYGNHDYISQEAMDTNHLNARGGRKLAARVDSLLQTIIE